MNQRAVQMFVLVASVALPSFWIGHWAGRRSAPLIATAAWDEEALSSLKMVDRNWIRSQFPGEIVLTLRTITGKMPVYDQGPAFQRATREEQAKIAKVVFARHKIADAELSKAGEKPLLNMIVMQVNPDPDDVLPIYLQVRDRGVEFNDSNPAP